MLRFLQRGRVLLRQQTIKEGGQQKRNEVKQMYQSPIFLIFLPEALSPLQVARVPIGCHSRAAHAHHSPDMPDHGCLACLRLFGSQHQVQCQTPDTLHVHMRHTCAYMCHTWCIQSELRKKTIYPHTGSDAGCLCVPTCGEHPADGAVRLRPDGDTSKLVQASAF